jgi:hypothetical protein
MSTITHIRAEPNTHELVFSESSRRAIDQFIQMVHQLYKDTPDSTIYLLLDLRESGMLPLRYLTLGIRELIDSYPHHPGTAMAIVLDDPTMINVTSALMQTIMRRDQAQYFTQIDKARLWLQLEYRKRG